MERGLYTAASGMLADQIRQDVIANNLANATTAGFKGDRTAGSAFASLLLNRIGGDGQPAPIGELGMGTQIDEIAIDASQGGMRSTQNELDLAMAGPGWFAVQAPGGVRYTRDGAFGLDAQRRLITADGLPVLGANGPITLPEGKIDVDRQGRVSVAGKVVDTLRVAVLDPKSLEKQGGGLYTGAVQGGAQQGQVAQGFLEASNVNTVREMVGLITTMRSYEASQKAVHALDETIGKAVNDVPRM